MTNRIELFEQMLAADPANTSVLFGLAKEYEKAGRDRDSTGKTSRSRASVPLRQRRESLHGPRR